MVATAVDKWGRVDILINNAGILRDKSFIKAELDDFRKVIDVLSDGFRHLFQGSLAAHGRTELRTHPHDYVGIGNLRQLRPGELRAPRSPASSA